MGIAKKGNGQENHRQGFHTDGHLKLNRRTGGGKVNTNSTYRWDINVRMSTIIGLVGGGGIGFLSMQYIRLLDYRPAGIADWFITITVATLDYVSADIRQRLV